jgi:ribose transport system ATP-binding protein
VTRPAADAPPAFLLVARKGPMSDFIVEMRSISKSFGGVRALRDVTFHSRGGEVHTVVGQNGAGKSTLMNILSGVYPPDSGEIFVAGRRVRFGSPHEAQEAGISIIHQELNLLGELSVAANVFMGRESRRRFGFLDSREQSRRAAEVLTRLGVTINPDERVRTLSVAQQQMVEIAKALSLNARVLIMDEPSATLGAAELARLFEVIAALKEHGVAVIYISHRLGEIFQIADWVTVFRDGMVVDSRSISGIDRTSLVRMMIGSTTFTEQFPPRGSERGAEVLRVEKLSAPPALRDVSLAVHAGEIVGLAGLMGSGRTELAQVIYGARGYSSGSVFLRGQPVRIPRPSAAIRRGIGYLPESRKEEGLVMGLSVLQNSALASLEKRQRLGFIARRREHAEVSRTVSLLKVTTPSLAQEVERLSGGNQQKIVIAKWLICHPDLLLFDEPTRGVDVAAKIEIWRLMRELAEHGAAILMISSEIPEIIGMSDRVLVMHLGKVAAEFPAEGASEETILTVASFGEGEPR